MPGKSDNPFRLFYEPKQWKVFRVIKMYAAAWLTPILLTCLIMSCTEPGWVSQEGVMSLYFKEDWVIWDVWFFDANKGIAVGDEGIIQQTMDGGSSWVRRASGTDQWLGGIYFTDTCQGWVVGRNLILYTNDGGRTWTKQLSDVPVVFSAIHCLDTSTAWAVGMVDWGYSIIYHTTNGGVTWIPQRTGIMTALHDVFFIDANTGIIVGGWSSNYVSDPLFSGYILRTTNGGATWNLQLHDTTIMGFHAVDFTDNHTVVVVGAAGTILRSTDGGHSWIRQESGTTVDLRDVCFINSDTGYVVGGEGLPPYQGGTILRSTNGGKTWTKQEIPIQNPLGSVCFTDGKNGIAGGLRTFLRTNSGGEPVSKRSRRRVKEN